MRVAEYEETELAVKFLATDHREVARRLARVAVGPVDRELAELRGLVRTVILGLGSLALVLGLLLVFDLLAASQVWPGSWVVGILLALSGLGTLIGGVIYSDRLRRISAVVMAASFVIVSASLILVHPPNGAAVVWGGLAAGSSLLVGSWRLTRAEG